MAKYENYVSNLEVLRRAPEQDARNEFIQSGIIDKFTLQFELGWKLLQKALRYEGRVDAATGSPRGVIKAAFSVYDFIDEPTWLAMLDDRNTAQHVYDSELAMRLVNNILDGYISEFDNLLENLERIYPKDVLESF